LRALESRKILRARAQSDGPSSPPTAPQVASGPNKGLYSEARRRKEVEIQRARNTVHARCLEDYGVIDNSYIYMNYEDCRSRIWKTNIINGLTEIPIYILKRIDET
jgi:hypothetical protein